MKLTQFTSATQIQTLKQTLNPQLIHMLKLFNQGYTDLLSTIQNETKDNVFLDIVQFDSLSEQFASNRSHSGPFAQDISDFARDTESETSLIDYVQSQIKLELMNQKDTQIALELSEYIDHRGYINDYNKAEEALCKKFNIKARKVHDILKIIQTLEPEGVGARSLKECLLIQLKSHNFENEALYTIFKIVISDYLDDLSTGNTEKMAEKLDLDENGISAIQMFIRDNLNPTPGNGFAFEQYNYHIIPSFEVRINDGDLDIINLEEEHGIQIAINKNYNEMLKDPNLDEKTKAFLKEKFKKAQELVDNIQRRRENLETMVKTIVERQRDFFLNGSAYLEPLMQKELAEKLTLSPSTVSRIVSSKYILTPHGTFPLKQLCPRDHFGKTAERLKQIVANIANDHPDSSDQDIATQLQDRGIDIARRTVTKYRQLANIKSSYDR